MRIAKYVIYDILRNRFVLVYTVFLLIITLSLFSLDSDPGKAMLSVLNIVLLAVPLISIVFTTGRRDSFTPTRAQQARKTLKSNAVWQHQKSARARTCRMVGRRAANVGLL